MSIEVHALLRLAVTKESVANFATDLTGTATYYDVPFQEGTAQLTLNTTQLEPQTVQQHIDAYPLSVIGPKQASLTFTMVLAPHGSPAGDTVASPLITDSALMTIIDCVFGGSNDANLGSNVTTGTSASEIICAVATGFPASGAVGWADTWGVHFHSVRSRSGSTIFLTTDLPTTPSASDVLYAATTFFPNRTDPVESMQFIVEGAETDNRWLLMGGQVTAAPTITREPGTLPTISFTIEFADWALEPAQAITSATYNNFEPTWVHGELRLKLGGGATTTRTLYDAARVEYTLNSPVYQKRTSPHGVNGIGGWERVRAVPFVEVGVVIPHEDAAWFTERDDREYYQIADQIGSAAGSIIFLETPQAQIWDVQPVDESGLGYQRLTFRSTIDTFTPDTGNQADAAFRMHFG